MSDPAGEEWRVMELPSFVQLTSVADGTNYTVGEMPPTVRLEVLDNPTLLNELGIDTSLEDDSTKLVGECQYTDLLPSAPDTLTYPSHLSSTTYITDPHHLDTDSLLQPVLLDDIQQQQLIDHLLQLQEQTTVPGQVASVGTPSESLTPTALVTPSTLATPIAIVTPSTLATPTTTATPSLPAESEESAPQTTTRKRRRQQDGPKAKTPRQRRPRKVKVYERQDPFEDPVAEKRRLNAINAKKNRDNKKKMLDDLDQKVQEVTKEKDKLEHEVQQLREREQQLRQELQSRYGVTFPPTPLD